jgi:hypothetical protein
MKKLKNFEGSHLSTERDVNKYAQKSKVIVIVVVLVYSKVSSLLAAWSKNIL